MGCNESKPLPLLQPRPRRQISEVFTPRTQLSINNFKTHKVQSISALFTLVKTHGSTETGTLFEAIEKKTKYTRMIREISTSRGFVSDLLFQEVNILKLLDHPNILKVFEIIESPRRFYVVFELIDGGTLAENIKKNCDEEQVSRYMLDIFKAIHYIHLENIVHCDINSDHVLLLSSQYKVPKLMGFSFSQKLNDIHDFDLKSISYHYASPEMLIGKYDSKTDLWSAGVLLYKLLVGKLPFFNKEKAKILEEIYTGKLDFTHANFKTLSNNAQDLIKSLLTVDSEKRPSASEALNHKWLQQCRKNIYLTYETVNRLRFFKVIFILDTIRTSPKHNKPDNCENRVA